MWKGKKKALTFSFDDGVKQDVRLIEILDKYGLKGTFNLNSARLGIVHSAIINGRENRRDVVEVENVRETYKNHEVAAHTLAHPNLTTLTENAIVWQVEEDRQILERLTGRRVRGMAYPCGGVNNDDRVAETLRRHTKIEFARTIDSTGNFELQDNLLRFCPTVYFAEVDKLFLLAEEFLALDLDKPRLFYVWGHAFELDDGSGITWKQFEEFCRLIANRNEIFYGTNSEILLNNN